MIRYIVCTGKTCKKREQCDRFTKYVKYTEDSDSGEKNEYYVLDFTPVSECSLFNKIEKSQK